LRLEGSTSLRNTVCQSFCPYRRTKTAHVFQTDDRDGHDEHDGDPFDVVNVVLVAAAVGVVQRSASRPVVR
jgi:hypothetical protein